MTNHEGRVARSLILFFAFPFRNCGCSVLAVFAGAVKRCRSCDKLCLPAASCLRRSPPAFYHQFVLSTPTFAGFTAGARSVPLRARTDRYRFLVIGYVVMSEHVHRLIKEPQHCRQSCIGPPAPKNGAIRMTKNAETAQRSPSSGLSMGIRAHAFRQFGTRPSQTSRRTGHPQSGCVGKIKGWGHSS